MPSVAVTSVERKGAVYTKAWVVDLLLDLAGYSANEDLASMTAVEPAAGDGAFVCAMAARLIQSCRNFGRPIRDSEKALSAYELDEGAAMRARDAVASVLLGTGVDAVTATDLSAKWIKISDFLLDGGDSKVDFVIGNPPYVRLEDVPEEMAELYRRSYPTMRGRADLYVGFFEAALHQLKPGGACVFICADRWMRNQYGAQLREFVTSEFSVDFVIEMHGADAFDDDVDAYPAVTVIRRKKQEIAVVATADVDAGNLRQGELAILLRATHRSESPRLPICVTAEPVEGWFEGSDPWPCIRPDRLKILRALEEQFGPLESRDKRTRVGIGVATGNDKVFITRDSELVEPERLVKLAMAKDIRTGRLSWSGHYLVDPWDEDGLVKLEAYPRLGSYFEQNTELVRNRNVARQNPLSWYRTIDRVTHSLVAAPKLYIADIKDTLNPVLDSGGTYPHHNLYFVQSEEWDLRVLGGLLMSSIAQFFVESYGVRMRGGFLRFQAQYLRRIRVPAPESLSESQCDCLREAFDTRDRDLASRISLEIYRLSSAMEKALGN